ncbi:hypothetical protein CO046_05145 [Candidatus Peregrinibacteria bacterium CG_4_9_14_0_2_um_filter_53_11]|nr:MAG: hypothetical protein CO046_05145 [Candidatus Peregrinibacteria bacterium CG_4_9_14_0_2_um_filter_53_11]
MFADPKMTLYLVGSISIGLLTIFLCVTLVYVILILRDASKVIEHVRETVDRVNSFIIKPVSLASSIVDHIRPIIENVMERRAAAAAKSSKKKR